jgi:hypothetical protein
VTLAGSSWGNHRQEEQQVGIPQTTPAEVPLMRLGQSTTNSSRTPFRSSQTAMLTASPRRLPSSVKIAAKEKLEGGKSCEYLSKEVGSTLFSHRYLLRDASLENSTGTLPVRRLSFRRSSCNVALSLISAGMLPLKELRSTLSTSSTPARGAVDGKDPVNLLKLKSTFRSLCSINSSGGMGPSMLFWERERNSKLFRTTISRGSC